MDKTSDLILGVLGTQWERTRPGGVDSYLESIKRSGFSGRKILLNWDIHPQTRKDFILCGFELVDLPVPSEPFFHARMRVCWEYLRDHSKEFRYIFWLDIKDLVLQSDPSEWMESNKGSASIIASTECVTIEQEETNRLWAQTILGEDKYQRIKDCEVINGGTWAGESFAMAEVFRQVHNGCKTYAGGYPPCQIWINEVLHNQMKKDMRIPRWSEGFAACLHPCWSPWRVPCWPNMRDAHPVISMSTGLLHAGTVPNSANSMMLFNPRWGADRKVAIETPSQPLEGVELADKPQGKTFVVVHGYDRDWDVKSLFEFKYRHKEDFNFKAFLSSNAEMARALPEPRRPLRRPKHEAPAGNCQLPQSGRFFRRCS